MPTNTWVNNGVASVVRAGCEPLATFQPSLSVTLAVKLDLEKKAMGVKCLCNVFTVLFTCRLVADFLKGNTWGAGFVCLLRFLTDVRLR